MKKLLCFVIAIALFPSTQSIADPRDFVFYDLSLAGYRLGMSFEDADALRPFQYSGYFDNDSTLYARIEQVFLDDVPIDLDLRFNNRKLYMINVRIKSDSVEGINSRLRDSFGEGEDRSKTLTNFNGLEVNQRVKKWMFPHAELFSIWTSNNKDFATISLSLLKADIEKLDDT